jgi:Putative lumazine-binding
MTLRIFRLIAAIGAVCSMAAAGQAIAAPIKNIVLVHGAFVDGSGWRPVYDILIRDGYNVSLVQGMRTTRSAREEVRRGVLDCECLQTTGGATLTLEEQAVVAPLQAFFDGIAKRDKAAMSAQVLPNTHATIIRGGKILQLSMKELLERSPPGTSTLEERFWDPLVRIDDDIALIWTPYDFLMDGKVHHCGTDVVNLVRLDGRWVIAGLADNSRTQCSRK